MNVNEIQKQVASLGVDAWIMVDYENHNPTMVSLLGHKMLTRKIIMAIPSSSRPYLIAHGIDALFLSDPEIAKEFDLFVYKTWQEMLSLQREKFKNYRKVAMDVSENGLLPRVSLADYGSVAFVNSLGIEVVSSADLLQERTSVLTPAQLDSQIRACQVALKIKDEAFRLIALRIQQEGETNEYEIQSFIAHRFTEEGMVYDEPPIVAIGPNASNPHYGPSKDNYSPIRPGDLVLIDMWAKFKEPESVYADITWMGYVGNEVPEEYAKRFAIIAAARDGAISFLQNELPKRTVLAYEADDVARSIIEEAGYGPYFTHRLGHSIHCDDSPHGPGANLDNLESHDTRRLLNGTSFSDEPGIYAPDFGMRTETDLHIQNGKLLVVGGLQDEIIPIMKLL